VHRVRRLPALPFLLASVFALALLAGDAPPARAGKIPVDGTDRYRVVYEDGSVSINDLCPVRKIRLGERKRPVWVNGTPVGFC
jgi:hypothetical protein